MRRWLHILHQSRASAYWVNAQHWFQISCGKELSRRQCKQNLTFVCFIISLRWQVNWVYDKRKYSVSSKAYAVFPDGDYFRWFDRRLVGKIMRLRTRSCPERPRFQVGTKQCERLCGKYCVRLMRSLIITNIMLVSRSAIRRRTSLIYFLYSETPT